MEPKRFQKPHPPIWFGASHPDVAAPVKHNGSSGPVVHHEQFAEQVAIVTARGRAAEAGRDAATFKIGKRVYIAIDDDASVRGADRRDAAALLSVLPVEPTGSFPVYGPPDACV